MMPYQHFVHSKRIPQLMQMMMNKHTSKPFVMIEPIRLNYPNHLHKMQFVQTIHSLMRFAMFEQMMQYLYFVHSERIGQLMQRMQNKHTLKPFVYSIHTENHLLMMLIVLIMMLNQIPEYFQQFLH
jgi:hypothetical protein